MKPDEVRFLVALLSRDSPRDVIPAVGIHHKRAWRILEKWAGKGWYEYGVSLDLGWLTEAGRAAATSLIPALPPAPEAGAIAIP